jgi:type IV pilus assembly protein PilY1
MKTTRKTKLLTLALSLGLGVLPAPALPEDIDIFTGASGGSGAAPNVLIVLDDTSNWSQKDQHWPDNSGQQGQAEVQALMDTLASLDSSVNVGLMTWTSANTGGGEVRFPILPMDTTNKAALRTVLTALFNCVTDPSCKVPRNATFEGILFDAWKYFGGYSTDPASAGTPVNSTHFGTAVYNSDGKNGECDPRAYQDGVQCSNFNPPIQTTGGCANNYVIFMANSGDAGPKTDTASLLAGISGDTTPLLRPTVTTSGFLFADLGFSNTCSTVASPSTSPFVQATDCSAGTLVADTTQGDTTQSCSITGQQKWMVQCKFPGVAAIPGSTTLSNGTWLGDNWTQFMRTADASSAADRQGITTYTLDAYNAKPQPDVSSLLMNMAAVGGGRYYAVKNLQQIKLALGAIFADITAQNSTFASASLPISATNREVSDNAVFIGQFRPDQQAKPRWFGNMKKYQLIDIGNGVELGDANNPGQPAVDNTTGFLRACATSFWSTDSGSWWQSVPETPVPKGSCLPPNTTFSQYSDAPDGPFVEKGSVAEVIRKGNNPPTTNTTPTWVVNRTVNTLNAAANAFATFDSTTASSLTTTQINWVKGNDTDAERTGSTTTQTRPSLHGDVIHSRPLVIDQGGTLGITTYYGSNDGTYRAIDSNGKELWAFIAPEQIARLPRLKDDIPLISFPGLPSVTPTAQPKDYFFDGSSGLYQTADNNTVWIYPVQRRGGRMIYAFNASTPSSPTFKWRAGCPDLTDDTGCKDGTGTAGMTGIGQTWSTPTVAFVKGYSTTVPVVILGGGYNSCEDVDNATYTCTKTTGVGNRIYVLAGDSGAVLQTFITDRAVAADVSLADIDFDGFVDYAYAADTGGNLYRIDFIDSPISKTPLANGSWVGHTVAYTNGANRKFLNAPALLPTKTKVYVALGTGDRERPLATNYPFTTPVTNRFYVYVDDLTVSPSLAIASATRTADSLITNLDSTSTQSDFTSASTCSTAGILPLSNAKGWFMDLNSGTGEQTVTSAVIDAGLVAFSTNRPLTGSAMTCSKPQGEARGYLVNLLNASGTICTSAQGGTSCTCGGSRSSVFAGPGGLPPAPVISTVMVNGVEQTVCIGCASKDPSKPSVPIQAQPFPPTLSLKRHPVYWYSNGDN